MDAVMNISPSAQTERLRLLCEQMKQAETRNQREQILEQMAEIIRTPTTTFYVEGL